MGNYKKDAEIEAELENVNIENYLEFDYQGRYEFKECEYCTGPLLGHIQPKCPKVEYDERGVKRFKTHLKNIGGFDASVKKREKEYRQQMAEWTKKEPAQRTMDLRKPRQVPSRLDRSLINRRMKL